MDCKVKHQGVADAMFWPMQTGQRALPRLHWPWGNAATPFNVGCIANRASNDLNCVVASQIDIVPTVLDLLGFAEHTRFMGRSVLHAYPDAGRAFIATYQKLGYLTPDQLVVLSPGRQIEDWQLDAQQELAAPAPQSDTLAARAIGIYQDTARRARDGLLQHVNLPKALRMR